MTEELDPVEKIGIDKDNGSSLYIDDIAREFGNIMKSGSMGADQHIELQLSSEDDILKHIEPIIRQSIRKSMKEVRDGSAF